MTVNNHVDVIGFDEGWNIMQTGITKLKRILDGKSVEQFRHDEYMMLYTTIYGMCINKPPHDYSQQLYDKYKECYDDYINSTVVPFLREKHGEFMLMELVNKWINHKVMLRWLSRFFHYLNRYFISRRLLPSLQEVGLTCFRDLVYEEFKVNATDIVIAQIDREREGQLINRAMLKNVLDIFVEVGMGKLDFYQNDFEDSMLNDTAAYYSRKASIWIVEDSCPEYMLKVEKCLKKEMDRVSHYLHYSSETKLIEKLQTELLVVHTNRLLEKEQSGCQALLRNDKVEDLSRMYRLFHDIPEGLEKVANMFNQHVVSEGTILVQQAENDATNKIFVRKVMDLHDKYSTYVTDCFSNHLLFQKAFKGAFEFFCNKKVGDNSNAEVLASFCDDVLKQGGSEKLSDEAIEETLDKVIKLLVYISDKDLFAEVHRKKLSRRLLFDKSSNDDHERLVLTKLKQLCGSEFTSKMEGMVTDLILAKEGNNHFQDYLSLDETPNPGIDFTVSVLTTGFWPNYKSSDMCLPVEMANCVQVFKDYYESKTKHKKLTWMYSLGTCHINGKFAQKTIELIVGTYQAAILLLFNSSDKLSYSDIKTELNMDDEDLIRLLHSLACAKYKILTKDPNTKSVSTTDTFTFNYEFTDKMRRIRMPLPLMEEKKKIVENVDNDRRYAIDAAIVRIMKSRKVMGHQQLVVECTEMLSKTFKPDMKAIKNRIENLMSRDFLERDPEDPNTFRYLA